MPHRKPREIVDAVAGNLILHRKGLGISLATLAARSGVSRRMLIEIEKKRSNPSIMTLCRLANALGVGVTELVASESLKKRLDLHSVSEGKVLWKTRAGSCARLITATSVHGVWAEFWHWRLAAGESYKGAAHPPGTKELLQVLAGRLCVDTAGESLCAAPSELLVLSAEAEHLYRNASKKATEFYMTVLEFSADSNRARNYDPGKGKQ